MRLCLVSLWPELGHPSTARPILTTGKEIIVTCLPKPHMQPHLPLELSLHSHLCFTDQILILLPSSPSVLFHSPKPQILICIYFSGIFATTTLCSQCLVMVSLWTFFWRTMLSLPSGSHKVFLLYYVNNSYSYCPVVWNIMLPLFDFQVALVVKNPPANAGDITDAWVRKIPWRRACQLVLVFLPGEFHGQRSMATVHGIAKSRTQLSLSPASLGNFLSLQVLA